MGQICSGPCAAARLWPGDRLSNISVRLWKRVRLWKYRLNDVATPQFVSLFEIIVSLPKQPSPRQRIEIQPRPRVDLVRHFSKCIDGSHAHSLMDRTQGRFEADQLGQANALRIVPEGHI